MPNLAGVEGDSRSAEGVKVLLSGVGGCRGPEGAKAKRDFLSVAGGADAAVVAPNVNGLGTFSFGFS